MRDARHAELFATLATVEQTHLLAGWDELSPSARDQLAAQIAAIDFALVAREYSAWHGARADAAADNNRSARAKSPQAIRIGGAHNRFSSLAAIERGEAALRRGEIGMILVAGGQGTRLGFEHPKGMFPIGPVSQRSLFAMLIDRLRAMAARYATRIPLFVMTSSATTAETEAYFQSQQDFGLKRGEALFFFEQGALPAVDTATGRVLLASQGEIALAPDGHGGMLAALTKQIGFARLQALGLTTLFYGQIDNPLLTVCDPEFLGYHLLAESELTTQVVAKTDPGERVGVVAEIDSQAQIIEYSDLSSEQAARREPDGSLTFWAGNTAVHAMSVALLQRASAQPESLPLHIAHKKVPHVDTAGKAVEPTEPNAIKFERFIFDLLPLAKNPLVVEVDRATSFAPVKNAEGATSDTAATAQSALVALHTKWLRAAGATVAPGVKVEIHPSFALDAAELQRRVTPGQRVTVDTYFQ